jgi:membrane protein
MIVLIFLYMVGAIFIMGAEINAALLKFRVRRMLSQLYEAEQREASKPDKTADVRR